jgi:phospholipase/carboxylesterase
LSLSAPTIMIGARRACKARERGGAIMLTGPSVGPSAGGAPAQLVVLLHGVGADGRDLIGLAPALAPLLPAARFVAPDGPEPCDMAPYGRQWFSLADRRPEPMLAGARRGAAKLDAWLDALLARHDLPPSRLALVGFSQGTMMALHVAFRRAQPIGAVLGFSGALLGPDRLAAELRARPPVMLIHGDADDVVPVAALHQAVAALGACEVPVQWLVRPGLPHSIDEGGITAGAAFMTAALGRAAGPVRPAGTG